MSDSTQPPGRRTFLAAARTILGAATEPLGAEEITRRALAAGLISTTGKTPAATMAAGLYTDIQRRGDASDFVRAGKGLFALRERPALAQPLPEPSPPVLLFAQDTAERLAWLLESSQADSANPTAFERALAEAFAYLGFRAQHVGKAGQTDIIVEAPVSAGPYRVVVDAKSSRSGRVVDAQIDWNSIADHRKNIGADYALVIGPDFGGGNLLRRADDYHVALLTTASVVELLRLHRSAPFSLVDLRVLFESPGPATKALEHLRRTAAEAAARWALLGAVLALIEQLPPGVYADAQKLWLLLSFQHRENAPTLEAVEDAVAVWSSRALGVLRPRDGSGEFSLTMQRDTALNRLRALAAGAARSPGGQGRREAPEAAAEPR